MYRRTRVFRIQCQRHCCACTIEKKRKNKGSTFALSRNGVVWSVPHMQCSPITEQFLNVRHIPNTLKIHTNVLFTLDIRRTSYVYKYPVNNTFVKVAKNKIFLTRALTLCFVVLSKPDNFEPFQLTHCPKSFVSSFPPEYRRNRATMVPVI